jgi:hypothetical protein
MIKLEYEMTYAETIDGPLGPTTGSPLGDRLCWQITTATLHGPRINATLAMPATDWIRLGTDGIRRQDLRAQLTTDDGELILFRYDLAVIRSSERFAAALTSGETTHSMTSTCGSPHSSRSVPAATHGSAKACSSDAGG